MRNERIRGYLDGIVLSIVATGDTYGYEIVQKVNERTHGALHLKEGSLYPALKRLEAEHFIEGYWGTDKETGPRRRYYTSVLQNSIFHRFSHIYSVRTINGTLYIVSNAL
ncbi:PadR family transcriptional regulator [Alicyclobacillus acidoterrestris]|uniref:PadR family transcriptional regulator n=1 Tax=Alicyclobacillus acidoterrestris TaxID=1450 RepID=UPI003F534E34